MAYPSDLSSTYRYNPDTDDAETWSSRQVMGYIRCPDTGRGREYSHGTWQEMRSALLSRVGIAGNWGLQDIRIALDRGDRPRRDWGPRLTVEQFLQWTRSSSSPVGWDEEIQADRDEWISDGLEEEPRG